MRCQLASTLLSRCAQPKIEAVAYATVNVKSHEWEGI